MGRTNQVTKNAVKGEPMDTSLSMGKAEEMDCVSTPIATETPNTTKKYVDGVKKIRNIVNKDAVPPMPMNGVQKSDMDESITVTDSINNLFEGSELSEEFKEKLIIIFESAVKEKTFELMTNLEEHYNATLEEEINSLAEVLIESIDTKLDYISSVWLEENELAIENGIKLELFENFIGGMKNLFQENYVDIPEERYDVLSDMNGTIEVLESKLNEQIEINADLYAVIQEATLEQTVEEVGKDLSENQKAKLRFLSEGFNTTSIEELTNKVRILKESSFPSVSKNYSIISEEISGDYSNFSDSMSAYVNAL